jgi:hypothetical protein
MENVLGCVSGEIQYVSELAPTAVGTLVPFGVVTVTWYVVPTVMALGPHTVTEVSEPPESGLAEKITLLLDWGTEKLTPVAPVSPTPVMVTSFDGDVHELDVASLTAETVDGVTPKTQLSIESVVPHVDELPPLLGGQFDALIVLGKSSKAMTAWSKGFNAHAVAAAFMTASVGVAAKLLWHT